MSGIRRVLVALVLLTLSLTLTSAPASAATTQNRQANNQEIDLAAFSFGYHGAPSGTVNPGTMTIRFRNTSATDDHEMLLFKVAPSHAKATVLQAISGIDAAIFNNDLSFFDTSVGGFLGIPGAVGGVFAPPGQSFTGSADLSHTGRYVYLCAVFDPELSQFHYHLGMVGLFGVASE